MLLAISRCRRCRCKLAFILGIIGYILSPLSWWNDAIVNIPIAIVVGTIFSLIDEKFFQFRLLPRLFGFKYRWSYTPST